jgi:hypothetical protein
VSGFDDVLDFCSSLLPIVHRCHNAEDRDIFSVHVLWQPIHIVLFDGLSKLREGIVFFPALLIPVVSG